MKPACRSIWAAVAVAVAGAAAAARPAALAAERAATPRTRTYANARIIAVDARAGTVTVRRGTGPTETLPVEAQALQRVGPLRRGEVVVLFLRSRAPGRDVVTRIERAAVAPSPRPSAAAAPAPSPAPSRLPTDTVGPLRDPTQNPNFDPRQNPLRDPRVVPGLSEPAPTPSPTPSPTPTPRGSVPTSGSP